MTKMRAFLPSIILLLILSQSIFAAEQLLLLDVDRFCINDSEFVIKGVTPGESKEIVLKKLGKPDRTGGVPDFFTFYYEGLSIDFCYESVGLISITGANIKTKSGIHPGLHRRDVLTLLKNTDILNNPYRKKLFNKRFEDAGSVVGFASCSDLLNAMQLEFDNSGYLKRILIGWDCP